MAGREREALGVGERVAVDLIIAAKCARLSRHVVAPKHATQRYLPSRKLTGKRKDDWPTPLKCAALKIVERRRLRGTGSL